MTEKICKNCMHWRPNGGLLGIGYCRQNQMGYRKPLQGCETKFVERQPTGVRVKLNDKWYEALYITFHAGTAMVAIEDEPNHFEWITEADEIEQEINIKEEDQ